MGSGVSESKMTDVDGPASQEENDNSNIDEKDINEDKTTERSNLDGGKGSNANKDAENEEANEEHGEDEPEKYKEESDINEDKTTERSNLDGGKGSNADEDEKNEKADEEHEEDTTEKYTETSKINEEGEDYAIEEDNKKGDQNDWFSWNSDENDDVGEDYAYQNHGDNHDHERDGLDVVLHGLHTTDANFEIKEHGDYAEYGEEYEVEDANTDVQISTNKTRQTFYQSHIFPLHLLKELKKGIGEASIGEASTFTKESKCSDESM